MEKVRETATCVTWWLETKLNEAGRELRARTVRPESQPCSFCLLSRSGWEDGHTEPSKPPYQESLMAPLRCCVRIMPHRRSRLAQTGSSRVVRFSSALTWSSPQFRPAPTEPNNSERRHILPTLAGGGSHSAHSPWPHTDLSAQTLATSYATLRVAVAPSSACGRDPAIRRVAVSLRSRHCSSGVMAYACGHTSPPRVQLCAFPACICFDIIFPTIQFLRHASAPRPRLGS